MILITLSVATIIIVAALAILLIGAKSDEAIRFVFTVLALVGIVGWGLAGSIGRDSYRSWDEWRNVANANGDFIVLYDSTSQKTYNDARTVNALKDSKLAKVKITTAYNLYKCPVQTIEEPYIPQ